MNSKDKRNNNNNNDKVSNARRGNNRRGADDSAKENKKDDVKAAKDDEKGGQQSHWASARAKMDVSKALAIMGFSSSRMLDHDAKSELNSALSKQMEIIDNPKFKGRRRGAAGRGRGGPNAPTIEEQQRDDVRMLHEAYQFLSRKFINNPAKEGAAPTTPEIGDGQPAQDWWSMKEEAARNRAERENQVGMTIAEEEEGNKDPTVP